MVKVVTTKSVTFTTPVLDAKGKPKMTKLKYNKREIEAPLVDHQRHLAGTVIEVDKEFAADLIARKLARVPDVASRTWSIRSSRPRPRHRPTPSLNARGFGPRLAR
jgi:hypothetical protein